MSNWRLKQCQESYVSYSQSRRILLDLDLNNPPPDEITAIDDTSFHSNSQEYSIEENRGFQQEIRNFVEVVDDDIAIIDRSIFIEAKKNSRRSRSQVINGFREVLNEAGGLLNSLSELATWYCKQQRNASDDASLAGDLGMNVEASNSYKVKNVVLALESPQNPMPETSTFNCPICIGPLSEATTTKCGHVFCKDCIKKAIAAQGKCPTCRKKLGKRGIIRVYLPTID